MKKTNEPPKVEHTPTPWKVTHQAQTDGTNDIVANGKVIAHLGGCLAGNSEHEANATFIVRAVNNHEALLEAAKGALDDLNRFINTRKIGIYEAKESLEKAIAQAEEEN